jgi:hypothetical protein
MNNEDERLEALVEAISLCIEPLTTIARELAQRTGADASVERAEDKAILAFIKLVDDTYAAGYSDGAGNES